MEKFCEKIHKIGDNQNFKNKNLSALSRVFVQSL